MSKFILTFILLCFLFISCDKNDPDLTGKGSLELVFKARFDTQAMVQGSQNVYDYFGQGTIYFDRADILYSDLKLQSSTNSVLVKDVDYVSLMQHHTSIALAEEGLKVKFENIPSGSYDSLHFNVGLTPDQNKTKPADYSLTHPLAEGTRYWSAWNSYIFSKTEGIFNNGMNNPFTYHSGFDGAMQSLRFVKNIAINDNQITKIEIWIDYKKLFEEGATGIDIPNNSQIHNMSSLMLSFMNRFQNAVSIK